MMKKVLCILAASLLALGTAAARPTKDAGYVAAEREQVNKAPAKSSLKESLDRLHIEKGPDKTLFLLPSRVDAPVPPPPQEYKPWRPSSSIGGVRG
jgi:hypothetical protein